ncbi:hypothetical protein [Cohnella sp. AR92]|uniref:hypothetical protein n=1 Tax=Cohnella sp. AR92 TaxID=648716 RepID=UPI000F8D9B6E|nr:hypothetical protein [Cohnella sp. AR92]RUS46041.1 hypothetical protein ELR57_16495 [Cohnella sp. AR92]
MIRHVGFVLLAAVAVLSGCRDHSSNQAAVAVSPVPSLTDHSAAVTVAPESRPSPSPVQALPDSAVVGAWQVGGTVVASGYNDVYILREDHSFDFLYNSMDCSKEVLGVSGTWDISGASVTLTPKWKAILVGGTKEIAMGSCASDYEIQNAKAEVVDDHGAPAIVLNAVTAQGSDGHAQDVLESGTGVKYWKIGDSFDSSETLKEMVAAHNAAPGDEEEESSIEYYDVRTMFPQEQLLDYADYDFNGDGGMDRVALLKSHKLIFISSVSEQDGYVMDGDLDFDEDFDNPETLKVIHPDDKTILLYVDRTFFPGVTVGTFYKWGEGFQPIQDELMGDLGLQIEDDKAITANNKVYRSEGGWDIQSDTYTWDSASGTYAIDPGKSRFVKRKD